MIELSKEKVLPPRARGHYKGHVKIFMKDLSSSDMELRTNKTLPLAHKTIAIFVNFPFFSVTKFYCLKQFPSVTSNSDWSFLLIQ